MRSTVAIEKSDDQKPIARQTAVDENLTLPQAIKLALENHPNIGRASALVAQSSARVAVENSALFPTIEYSVNPGYNRYGGTDNANGDKASVSGTIGASQLIYDFGRTSSRVKAATATYDKQRYTLEETKEEVASSMATIFIALSGAQETIEAARRETEALTVVRDRIAQRVQAGLSDVVDLNEAEIALQHAKTDLLQAQTNYDVAAGRFAEMVGIRPKRVASLEVTAAYIGKSPTKYRDIDSTPSVLAATAELRAAEQRLRLAKSDRYPSISIGVSQSEATGNRNVTNDSTFMGLKLGGSFSVGRKEKYQIEAAQAELRAAQQARENEIMATRTALGSAETQQAGALSRMTNAEELKRLSVSSRDLYWQQYTLNKRPLTDVVNVERDKFSAENDYIIAQTDQLLAVIKSYSAVGQLVPRLRGETT